MNDNYTSIIREYSTKGTSDGMTDAPITGNGDVSVIWLGSADKLKIVIAKSDVWNAQDIAKDWTGLSVAATLDFLMPTLGGRDYYVEQRMKESEIYGRFDDGTAVAEIRTIVCACENTIILELKITGARMTHSIFHNVPAVDSTATTQSKGRGDGFSYTHRSWNGEEHLYPTHVMTTMKELPRREENGARIYTYVIGVMTNHDSAAYESLLTKKTKVFSERDLEYALFRHNDWWKAFWEKSSVDIGDEKLERAYHGGLYIMACCARNKKFPPGLYGNFAVSDSMPWRSDYHLNYNYQAPFYALASSNHVELMECYDAPLLDFMYQAEMFASEFLGCNGIYYPVGIGPLGVNTSTKPVLNEHHQGFLGQKSNAAYSAVIMAMRWKATLDEEYAKNCAYPFFRKLADFWEDYLTFVDGRYMIYNDCIGEIPYFIGPSYISKDHDQVNPIIELGFIRMIFKNLLHMSSVIKVDEHRREKWEHILAHISPFPTMERNGKTIFRLSEVGQDWQEPNTLALQHVYPTGEIGLDSGELREIAVNTFHDNPRWEDSNGFCQFFPCAARLGIDPDLILDKLRENIDVHMYTNMAFEYGGGGIENASPINSTINEMLMQSHEGVVRFFPVWNRTKNASFKNLRADGAFIVSASLEDGKIKGEIFSEKGADLTVENPYKDAVCTVEINGEKTELAPAQRLTLKTKLADRIFIY